MTLRRPTQMASSPPRSCSKQSGWPSLCPRSPAYARSHARASPPPPPVVGTSFSGAYFSFSSRFHHPRSTLCHPVRARPHRSGPPQRGQALTEAPRAPRAMRPLFTPYESAPRDARCPTPPSPSPTAEFSVCAPTHRPRRSPPGRPAHYDTYGTPEPGYLTLSFASDARLAVLPESSHHLLHGLPRRHSIRI